MPTEPDEDVIRDASADVGEILSLLEEIDRHLDRLKVIGSGASTDREPVFTALVVQARDGSRLCRDLVEAESRRIDRVGNVDPSPPPAVEIALEELAYDERSAASFAAVEELILLQLGVPVPLAAELRSQVTVAIRRSRPSTLRQPARGFDVSALSRLADRFDEIGADLEIYMLQADLPPSPEPHVGRVRRLYRKLRELGHGLLLHTANDEAARIAQLGATGAVATMGLSAGPTGALVAACAVLVSWKLGPAMSKRLAGMLRERTD